MKPDRSMRLERVMFLLSAIVMAVLFGSYGATRGWFPHPQIRQGLGAWHELTENWRNDLELEPTRHLVKASTPGVEPFLNHAPGKAFPGNVIIAGLTPHQEFLHGAVLYDGQGEELHRWAFDYESLDPEGPGEFNVLVHGVAAYPDGSLIVAFDAGKAIARVDACGDTRWFDRDSYHHVVSGNDDGTLWTWRAESLVKLDADNGKQLSAFDFRQDVVDAQDLHGSLAIRTLEKAPGFKWFDDPFHANDVEALTVSMADAFPQFEAGDLLISLRELNMVAVIDPGTHKLKWYRHGPWFKQHDPDFQPNGRISVYDNRMGLEGSRIVSIDPATDDIQVLLADSPDTPFYSWRRGKHQILGNGNLLITESERGRVFEVTPDGELVWERRMVYDDEQSAIVTSAEKLAVDFFDEGALDCR